MKRLHYVDSLRGIAVMLVVLVHVGVNSQSEFFTPLSHFGQFGVQLFFLMSAFTLSASYRYSTVNLRTYAAFLTKRFFRIAPLYYLALLGYYLLTLFTEITLKQSFFTPASEYTLTKVAANLFFLHGFYPEANNSIVPGGWSIACEFLFYAFFPFIFRLAQKRRAAFFLLVVPSYLGLFGLMLLARLLGRAGEGGNNSFWFYNLANQLPVFLLGILLYNFQDHLLFSRIMKFSIVPSVIFLGLFFNSQWGWIVTPLLAGIAFTGLALIIRERTLGRWLDRIGELSFSIYLWHFAVVWLIGPSIQRFVTALSPDLVVPISFMCVIALTIAVSTLSYRYVELRFIDLGRKLALQVESEQRLA